MHDMEPWLRALDDLRTKQDFSEAVDDGGRLTGMRSDAFCGTLVLPCRENWRFLNSAVACICDMLHVGLELQSMKRIALDMHGNRFCG